MRLLWFSNRTPAGAKSATDTVGGSWIEALENEFMGHDDIELGIVFKELEKEPKEISSSNSSTRYFMVPRHPYGKFARWFERVTASRPSEKPLQDYLRIVDEFKPDVILFFGTESDFPLIIPKLTVPSVIWFQGNLTVYERMYESGIPLGKTLDHESLKDMLMGDSVMQGYRNYGRLVEREKKIFSMAKNFIGRTNWDRRLVSIMAPQAKYHFCDEPMRRPFWEREWTPQPARDKFVVTTTIRGNLYKGLETVFEACRLLTDRIEKPVEWRVFGISEGGAYVKTARKKAGYPKSRTAVKLVGSKSAQELAEELLNADVYVHPSHIENSPNAVQEAMLLGMPVIATNVGGTPSLLEDGSEGLLVQNKDPYAMAGAILELYRFPDKAYEMGQQARKRGLDRNDNTKISSDLLSIFEELAGTANKALKT